MLIEQLGEGGPNKPPKLMDRVRGKLRVLHLSKRTEKAYVGWIVRFISFHRDHAGRWVRPENMTGAEVSEFLTHLAVVREVSASTQNQAFSALLFLYTKVLGIDVKVDSVRAKRRSRSDFVQDSCRSQTTVNLPAIRFGFTFDGSMPSASQRSGLRQKTADRPRRERG